MQPSAGSNEPTRLTYGCEKQAHPTIKVFSSMNLYSGTSRLVGAGPLRTRPEVS